MCVSLAGIAPELVDLRDAGFAIIRNLRAWPDGIATIRQL
jgi:hypothetical protein